MPLLVALVRTHSPGNLGAAARAARNFGASLALLSPRTETAHADARAMASGAEDVLDGAAILSSWEELEARAELLVALTSLRGRRERGLPPRTSWAAVRREAVARPVALVFGPERGGLTSDELRLCGARLSITASPEFPTLNLAQSVAVTLALLTTAAGRPRRDAAPAGEDAPAPARDLSRLLTAWRETLAGADYPGRGRNAGVLAETEAFLRRGRPTRREVALLLGAFAAMRRGRE